MTIRFPLVTHSTHMAAKPTVPLEGVQEARAPSASMSEEQSNRPVWELPASSNTGAVEPTASVVAACLKADADAANSHRIPWDLASLGGPCWKPVSRAAPMAPEADPMLLDVASRWRSSWF